ncbi:T9SS type A sorting domain-containing protein [Myroides sp. JBRI-B21084]|uniref:T9SS type A sorting domain-containing protein n=1 Tax=Myroides sp. JBRI-B21084 TaxID=3119977 RepID=UPI0026E1534A|nr:T9SS type A sorting domain-containing protein [Paenimyroides cloacae]WKW46822.1 T9SS type A sorting domain-containing protein [Paenimyroides cloacae]
MKKHLLFIATCLIIHLASAQVLFTEDFNSYPTEHLNTDYTGATAGQGGWVVERYTGSTATAMVTPESGKGNVLTMATTGTFVIQVINILQSSGVIDALWNNRTAGNNVLKLEYELYGSGNFYSYGQLDNNTQPIFAYTCFVNKAPKYTIGAKHSGSLNIGQALVKNYTAATFPHSLWHKVEMFIDYTGLKAYFYIPTLNLFEAHAIDPNKNYTPDNIKFQANSLVPGSSVVKYDNIKLSALQTVPAYILSAHNIVSAKFNMYPNPATNVVNITNSENMLVEKVTVYNLAGKQISTQNYNNQTEIQLNVANLASGTYMLHLQTHAGLIVKKLVKK